MFLNVHEQTRRLNTYVIHVKGWDSLVYLSAY